MFFLILDIKKKEKSGDILLLSGTYYRKHKMSHINFTKMKLFYRVNSIKNEEMNLSKNILSNNELLKIRGGDDYPENDGGISKG